MPLEHAQPAPLELRLRYPFWFRFFEILPGTCLWLALISPFILARFFPLEITLFIVIFDAYWLQKAVYTAYLLSTGWGQFQRNLRTDWPKLVNDLHDIPAAEREAADILDPTELYNAVILTTYKEEPEILESSIRSIADARYDKQKLIVVVATEGREGKVAKEKGEYLMSLFKDSFYKFIVTEHPDGIVGEVKGKGANATWAARELTEALAAEGIAYDKVVVTTADADCRFHPTYFSCLAFQYATTPERVQRGFQPVATFLNNVWEAPMLSRVMAFSTTFWHMAESVRDYRLFTFSTHAVSLQTLVDINYWCVSVVNEDSRQYFRSFFHYNGNFKVIPLFMPVYMDAVLVQSPIETYKNLYLQQQRWAYGVEHFPYIVLESIQRKTIPLVSRIMLVWRAFHGTFSWGTNAFFITVVGWLPILMNESFRDQLAASNFPQVTRFLLTATWIGIIVSNVISFKLLPPFPEKNRLRHVAAVLLQWVFIPVSTIMFGAAPGIDSQTRLMLGKYLGFRVTEKKASPKADRIVQTTITNS